MLNVGQLTKNSYSFVLRNNYCNIYDKFEPNQVIVEVKMKKINFHLQFHYNAFKNKVVNDSWLWHKNFVTWIFMIWSFSSENKWFKAFLRYILRWIHVKIVLWKSNIESLFRKGSVGEQVYFWNLSIHTFPDQWRLHL